MVKKLKAVMDDDSLATAVRTSAAQIWQAGLGAFAKAQEEGGRVFSKLVKDGAELQKKGRQPARGAAGLRTQGGATDKLEQVFEDRVARALATIGVPDCDEIDELKRRVDQLAQQVAVLAAALEAESAPAPRRAARAPAKPAKPVAKKAKAPAKAAAKAVAKKAAARKSSPRK